jgi:hypothetical protein
MKATNFNIKANLERLQMQDWHKEKDGENFRYLRETLLNYGLNRWGLNKASSIGKTSELIRNCAPKTYQQWVDYYFSKAMQNKQNGLAITPEYLEELGKTLYIKLTEVVCKELESISLEECIDYVYNLVINRTFEGYQTEIKTIYGILEMELGRKIIPAPDKWDRSYSVDFYIEIKPNTHIGIQIKPITGNSLNDYQWIEMHRANHERFTQKYHGRVFFVYSKKVGDRKVIYNPEVVSEILLEVSKLEL